MNHYYIWYRVPGDPVAARASVDALQADIARRCGVVGRLLTRTDDRTTFLEIYENIVLDTSVFDAILADAVSASGFAVHAPEGRHVECFVDAR